MSQTDMEFTSDKQHQLDLLVDGELSEVNRRRLLVSFDGQPGAWRRCALAFLEAQTWRNEARTLERGAGESRSSVRPLIAISSQERVSAVVPPAVIRRWWSVGGGLSLAMAACFLVAFSLGWMIRSPGFASVQDARVDPPAIVAVASADSPRAPGIASDGTESADRWGTVTLIMDGGPNDQREISYPVIEGAGRDDHWLDAPEPVVSRELRDALERLGHHVDERRQFVPLDLQDGRQLIVPVDEVEFTPVGMRAYQ
ncbi:MAG TPA: hypothetical protein VGG64_10505 [Pirellulales bacterium]|jgi:hypothetical protein